MALKIIIPGAFTTVQDGGRYGYQELGIPVSGVMDLDAYEKGNYLVGNTKGEAVLEASLYGGVLEASKATVLALTGADMKPAVNEIPVSMNRPLFLEKGDTLSFGMAERGCRTYIAAAGGIDVPVIMGSRSTNVKCGFGGYEGRSLKAGDILETGRTDISYEEIRERRVAGEEYLNLIRLRTIPGPQEEYFTEEGRHTFYQSVYRISEQRDRMGYRMEGPDVESVEGTDIISDGIPKGAIQITASGQPIVLLADRQTTGGYAKIGVVCSFDLPKLAQGRPGDRVCFQRISAGEAQKINERKGKEKWITAK